MYSWPSLLLISLSVNCSYSGLMVNYTLLSKYVSLRGILSIELFENHKAIDFQEIINKMLEYSINVILYYGEGPKSSIKVRKDETVTDLIVIMYKQPNVQIFNEIFDRNDGTYLIKKKYLKAVHFKKLESSMNIKFNPELEVKKTIIAVLAASHIHFRINLVRDGRYINTQFVLSNTHYYISAFFINLKTKKKYRPKKKCIKMNRNGSVSKAVPSMLKIKKKFFLLKCLCSYSHRCSQRFSPFTYDPGNFDMHLSQENTYINGEKKGTLKISMLSTHIVKDTEYTTFFLVKESETMDKFSLENSKFKFSGVNQVTLNYFVPYMKERRYVKVALLKKKKSKLKLIKVFYFTHKLFFTNLSFYIEHQFEEIDNLTFKRDAQNEEHYMIENFPEREIDPIDENKLDIYEDYIDSAECVNLSCIFVVCLATILLTLPIYA